AGQINGAMQQLDQVTQQNAAASEQLAATAQEMRGQSQALLEMISFFQLCGQQAPPKSKGASPTNGNSSAAVMNFASEQTVLQEIPGSKPGSIDEGQFERF
ncbi:MAG: methyl-accepting chemotaxis protein, partial [Gammaproteobacteria bacterium]|nr:methyl-accepting chemotaxis protein [Gammaproteobacteria bacterium]